MQQTLATNGEIRSNGAPFAAATASPDAAPKSPKRDCRFCGSTSLHLVVDLGASPLCQSFLSREELDRGESFYPLRAYVCDRCFLFQVPEHVGGTEIFGGEYAYFSSYADSWLAHARRYCEMAVERFKLDERSQVIEVASNDGYLLRNFVSKGVPALGIEPADNVAEAAIGNGVPTLVKFFGTETARELVADGRQADLLIGNNVLAHVPDLNDFVEGMKLLLKPDGVITMEFPHLMRLMERNQFDTIYQEHYCYFSFIAVEQVFAAHGLTIFDVEELPTHGGSLRIYASHSAAAQRRPSAIEMKEREVSAGFKNIDTYRAFAEQVAETKRKLLEFVIQAKREGKSIVGYGAPGKGSTLLNYCGIREDFIDYAVDRNPYKQGRYFPGVRIPVLAPEKIAETKPDYILILPWNLKDEITEQLDYVRSWGAKFVVPIPELTVYP